MGRNGYRGVVRVRQIGRRKPEKAIAALLAYLSAAEDELAIAEVRDALTALLQRWEQLFDSSRS